MNRHAGSAFTWSVALLACGCLHAGAGGVRVERDGRFVHARWSAAPGERYAATFELGAGRPLIAALEAGGARIAEHVQPVYVVTTGSRVRRPGDRFTFFDKPANRPTESARAMLTGESVQVQTEAGRATLTFSRLSAGPFSGDLVVRIYAGSPLLELEAAMAPAKDDVAYIYDAVLEGRFAGVAWKDPQERFMRAPMPAARAPIAVRHRTIMAETEAGTIAVFPPPHAFFFPRDYSDNFGFAQAGAGGFGLRQDPAGGAGHRGLYAPWFDAPAGRTQRMTMYIMPSRAPAEPTLARVAAYTRGDRYAAMDGRLTFSSHWHAKLTVSEGEPHPRAPDFVRALEAMNVNLVHLAEFHGEGHASDPGPLRLPELQAMFGLCRKYADGRILLMPGEEANAHFPGHWLYFFPKPVYLTLVHPPGAPFLERLASYGDVYHVGSESEMAEVLRREKGLAWTAHPRIKGSAATPDQYRDREWYRDDLWLGGTWKAMPADLSEERLGRRSLDLLDEMNQWGQRKQVLGEADLFDIDPTHELWGHMNVNYLRLARMPTCDDWSPVLDVLRRGDFFVTTGELLIHSFDVEDGKAIADLEWTFPLSHVALVTSDGTRATRRVLALTDTTEHARRRFEWPLDVAGVRWVRLEAWDVARNTAFTQPLWR